MASSTTGDTSILKVPKLLEGVCSEIQAEALRAVESIGEGSVSSAKRLRFMKKFFFSELG